MDIETTNITTQDYQSEVRFANLTGLGTATVTVQDTIQDESWSFGSLNIGEASEYTEINSGSRTVVVDFPNGNADTTMLIVFSSEKKGTVFITGDTTEIKYINSVERYTFDSTPTYSDSIIVRVFNGFWGRDTVSVRSLYTLLDTVSISYDTVSTEPLEIDTIYTTEILEEDSLIVDDLLYGKASSYQISIDGTYIITVDTSGVAIFSDTLVFDNNKRYTMAVFNTVEMFEDD